MISPMSDIQRLFHNIGDCAFNTDEIHFLWRPYQYADYSCQHTTIQRWFHKYGDRLIALPIFIKELFEKDSKNHNHIG